MEFNKENKYYCLTIINNIYQVEIIKKDGELEHGTEPYLQCAYKTKGIIKGLFPNLIYAQAWCDFYNKKIDKNKLSKILDNY